MGHLPSKWVIYDGWMFFFCTPVHRSVQACRAGAYDEFVRAKQHFPSPMNMGSAVSAWLSGGIGRNSLRMLAHRPIQGMQGLLESQIQLPLPKPRMYAERPYEFPGHPSLPKAASRRANAHV